MIQRNYNFKNEKNTQFNDIVYPGSAYKLNDCSFSFTIKPKVKFWRFGIRLSRNENINFYTSGNRHKILEGELYKDIHLGVGNWYSEENIWRDANALNLVQYNVQEKHFLYNCNYTPESEINWTLSYNKDKNLLYITLTNGDSDFNGVYDIGKDFIFFKIFAWADNISFEIDCDFVIKPNNDLVSSFERISNKFKVGNLQFRWGDMIDVYYGKESNLIILPASTNGNTSIEVKEKAEQFNLQYPPSQAPAGSLITFINAEERASHVGYGYSSFDNGESSIDIIVKLVDSIATYAKSENHVLGYHLPLFGTGTGQLLVEEIANVYDLYLNKSNITSILTISILKSQDFIRVRNSFFGKNITELDDDAYTPKNIANLRAVELLNITRDLYEIDLQGNTILLNISYIIKQRNVNFLVDFPKLKKLFIVENYIDDFSGLLSLQNLEDLDLSMSKINDFSFLSQLKNLKKLNISSNQIENLDFIRELPNLEFLTLNSLRLTGLDFMPDDLPNLKSLSLAGNQIVVVDKLKNYKNLSFLNLRKNQISNISSLIALTELIELNLGFNNIIDIEPTRTLLNLQTLSINNNYIYDPKIILKLENLGQLQCQVNPFVSKFNLILRDNENHLITLVNALKKHYEDGNEEFNLPAKVLLLGNHASGKSSLLQYIISNEIINAPESTHIVKIEKYLNESSNTPMAIFFDFGGQDYYHGIYRAFLTGGSVYIILWNSMFNINSEREDANGILTQDFSINYWLHQKRHLENEKFNTQDPLLLVQTHSDVNSRISRNPTIFESELDIRNEFFVSLRKHNDSDEKYSWRFKINVKALSYLKESILSLIDERKVTQSQPRWYIDFFQYILEQNSSSGHLPVNVSDVLTFYGNTEINKLEFLYDELDQLNRQGLVLYFRNDLPQIVWLNPVALVKYVHDVVLNKEHIARFKGRVPLDKFKDFNKNIIELLCLQKVIFRHTGFNGEEYITPNFLPLVNEDDDHFDLINFGFENTLFVLQFTEFLPFGMINQIICHFKNLPNSKKFWRNQLMFTIENKAKVLIFINFSTLTIEISASFNNLTSKQEKNLISRYLFYSIIGLYWDLILFDFDDFKKFVFKHLNEDELRNSALESRIKYEDMERIYTNPGCFPKDLYISFDNELFIKYSDLTEIGDSRTISAKKDGTEGNIVKEIQVQPFEIFTNRNLKKMKKIFVSYSKHDESYKEEFRKHLITLKDENLIEDFNCKEIDLGVDWDATIQREIDECDYMI